jgi:ABC-type multidrug transport system permease subunit
MSHHHEHEHYHPPTKHWARRFWWAIAVFAVIFMFMTFYLANLIMY